MTSVTPKELEFSERLKLFILLPFFTVGLILAFVLFIFPFYIYRSVIYLIARCSYVKFSSMVTGLSASLLRDYDVQEKKPLSSIVVSLKLRGKREAVTLPKLREVFRSRVILKRDPNDEKYLQFPQLQQYYQVFMGYVFLVWDRKFDLTNHITEYTPPSTPMSKEDLLKLREELMIKPFKKEMSPWEVILIDNGPPMEDFLEEEEGDEDREFYMLLRIHHGLADGFSVQNLLLALDNDQRIFSTGAFHVTKIENFLINLRTVIRGPYDLLKKLIINKEPFHTLHFPTKELTKEYFVTESDLLSVKEAKKIRNHFKAEFTAVLTSAVCGGIRRYLEKSQRSLPSYQVMGLPYATKIDDQPVGRLENDFFVAPFDIPIHLNNPLDRTLKIQRQLAGLKNSALPQMLGIVISALSCLPVNWMRKVSNKSLFSTAFSTLPGPMKAIYSSGWRLVDVNFTYGTGAANLGLGFSSITYVDKFRFMVFVDKKVMMGQRRHAEELVRCIQEEFHVMSGVAKKM